MDYSILMSVYHKEKPEYLKEAIESMLSQTVKSNDFVIVCDGPLTKELYDVIEFYEKDKSIYSMKHFEINNISFDVGYGEKYAIDVTNERLEIVGMQVLGRKPIRMIEKDYVRNSIIIKTLEYIACNNWRKRHGLPMLKHYSHKTK